MKARSLNVQGENLVITKRGPALLSQLSGRFDVLGFDQRGEVRWLQVDISPAAAAEEGELGVVTEAATVNVTLQSSVYLVSGKARIEELLGADSLSGLRFERVNADRLDEWSGKTERHSAGEMAWYAFLGVALRRVKFDESTLVCSLMSGSTEVEDRLAPLLEGIEYEIKRADKCAWFLCRQRGALRRLAAEWPRVNEPVGTIWRNQYALQWIAEGYIAASVGEEGEIFTFEEEYFGRQLLILYFQVKRISYRLMPRPVYRPYMVGVELSGVAFPDAPLRSVYRRGKGRRLEIRVEDRYWSPYVGGMVLE